MKNEKLQKFLNSRYSYPLVCDLYIGSPGSGKSSLAAKLAYKDLKHGKKVYSNVPIQGTYILDPKNDIGKYDISNGRMILDEIGICFNNRNFKTNLPDHIMEWLKKHRHARVHIDCFSQGLDFDNRFIGLARNVYIVRRGIIPGFVVTRRVARVVGVDKEKEQLADKYRYVRFSLRIHNVRKYWKLFDSYEMPIYPNKEWKTY